MTGNGGFNGAIPVKGWKDEIRRLEIKQDKQLQWGHPCEGMEKVLNLDKELEIFKLQWGHPCEGMEMRTEESDSSRHLGFNGAIPVKGWKHDNIVRAKIE